MVWLGGRIGSVDANRITLREDDGSVVSLQRLAKGATGFFRVSGDHWTRLSQSSPVSPDQAACIETLMDRTNLVAIRVFLDSGCGPI